MASFLLNLLSHLDFRAPFGHAYVLHYKMFPHLLLHGTNKRHMLRGMDRVSIQIFGAASRSLQLTNEMHLLHVMVFGLQSFLTQISTANDDTKIMSTTHPAIGCLNEDTNIQSLGMVVDVTHPAITNDYYWPLLIELEHVLRHRGVCLKFLEDDDLPKIWFDLVAFLQGMNPSRRELKEHIEYDDDVIYHSTFQFEWCLSSLPTCAMLSHLRVEGTTHLTKKMIAHCLSKLKIWSQNFHTKIQNGDATTSTRLVISFHHPLHRQLAAFLSHAIQHQNLTLTDLLPVNEEGSNFEPELKSICWTLIQFFGGFYEILNGLWARNGYHVKSQAANYVRDFYCSSMIDLDLYLLQVTMMRLPGDIFLDYLFTRFDIDELLQLEIQSDEENEDEDHDDNGMLESLLIFLATMATVRNCMGGGGVNDDQRITLEVATQLAIGDCTHSELRSSIENKNRKGQQASSSSSRQTNFDAIFEKLANFRQPTLAPNGNLMEGQYSPKSVVWENHFDPIFLLLRAQSRDEFQTAMNRFEEFAKKSGKIQPSSSASGLWPPYRVPLTPPPPPYSDPRLILLSPKIQTLLFIILHRAVHTSKVTEQVMSLAVHLLELALTVAAAPSSLENFESSDEKDGENELMASQNSSELPTSTSTCDQNYPPFFTSGTSIFKNLQTEIYASKLGSSVSVQNFKETFISLLLKLHGKLSKNGLQTCAINHIFDFENHKNCGNDSRIGDGPFFVGKLLQKIATLDPECKTDILCIQKSLIELAKLDHHHQDETNNETTECVQDKRRIEAKERQLKLLAEFGKKQKEFLENLEISLPTQNDDDPININPGHKEVTYDCVICNQSSSPTPYEPLGLLTLVKSSNILGHRRPINFQNDQLPLAHSDQQNLAKMSQTHFGQNEVKFFQKYFHQRSFTSSISLGWSSVGGMQVQTCGHYLHSHCLRGYLGSPLSWLSSEYEFQCPLCRQVVNSFLPILPQYEKPSQNQHEEEGIEQKIYKFLQLPRYKQPDRAEMDLSPFTPLGVDIQIFGRLLLHSNDAAPYRQSDQTKIPVTNRLHLLGSILQANLEQEILKRGGSLVTPQPQSGLSKGSSLGSGRSCLAPLIPALRHQYKELFADEKFEGDAHKIWERIVGIKFDENFENFDHHVDVDVGDSDSTRPPANGDDDDECEVPLFLRDPCAIFLNLVIALPLHVDLVTFTTVVQVVYNFAVAQILTTNSHKFPSHERNHLCSLLLAAQKSTQIDENQETNFDTKNDQSRHTEIGKNFKTFSPIPVNNSKKEACAVAAASKNVPVDSIDKIAQPIVSLEAHIERLLLPFLKIAAFLKHQIFDVDLPCAESCDVEFEFLSKFLQLGPQSSSSKNQNEFDKKLTTLTIDPILVKNVHWLTPQPVKLVKCWCDELCHFTKKFQFADDAAGAGGSLLQIHKILWAQPKLLSLPQGFDTLFNFYETVKCPNCSKIPATPTLCLLCGALICLAESCCNFNRLQEKKEEGKVDLMEKDKDVVDGVEKDWDICEGTKHAINCGGGTGIFLNLRSSSTLIIYEERACHWGSLYLDAFGEEDFELRRGKPLYLSKERYQLLEQQWTNQGLGYAAREWYYHNNGL